MIVIAVFAVSLALQADKFPPFTAGTHDVTFEKSPPHCDADELKARFHSTENAGPWDVTKEKFKVWIPKSYAHDAKWGLFVYVNADDSANIPSGYEAVLEKHKLLAISAYKSGNERNFFDRFRLAIDANFNMSGRFNIDGNRVYLSGISGGGRTASMVAVAYADLFSGAIPFCGVNFYTPIPGDPGKAWPPSYIPCGPALKIAKSSGRYVLVTGEKDMNLKNTRAVYDYGFKKEGFKHATVIEVPGMGHTAPPPETFDKGLDFLDKPPK